MNQNHLRAIEARITRVHYQNASCQTNCTLARLTDFQTAFNVTTMRQRVVCKSKALLGVYEIINAAVCINSFLILWRVLYLCLMFTDRTRNEDQSKNSTDSSKEKRGEA